MSKKKLLEEGTVRRFMKLAGTEALTTNVLKEQDELAAEAPPAPGGEDLELDADIGDLELEEPGEEPGEEPEGEVEDAVRAMVDAIADVAADFGVDVDVETEEAPEIEVGAEPEPEEELELGGEEGEITGEFGGEEELAEQKKGLPTKMSKACQKACDAAGKEYNEEKCDDCKSWQEEKAQGTTSLEEIDYIDEDAVMNEVFHRVKNRLLQEKRADDMSSVLAKRIMKRLGKKLR